MKMLRRTLSILICVTLMLSLMPFALADEIELPPADTTIEDGTELPAEDFTVEDGTEPPIEDPIEDETEESTEDDELGMPLMTLFTGGNTPTAAITMETVDDRADGKTIYKLVATAYAETGIKGIETWIAYDNSKVVPVNSATGNAEVTVAEGQGIITPFKRDFLKNDDGDQYTVGRSWYINGNKTIVRLTLDVETIMPTLFNGTYMEFYFRLADGVTLDDFDNTTFAIENQDTTPNLAKAWNIQTGDNTEYLYYNKNLSGTPANTWEPTLTYHNSTTSAGYKAGTVAVTEKLDFTKLENTPVKNGVEFITGTGIYWEKLDGEYTLTLNNANIDVTGNQVALTIPSGITVQFMGNSIIGGAGHTGQGIRASYSGSTATELEGHDIKFVGIDGASVTFNTTNTGINVYTDLNGTTMTVENLKISAQRLAIGYVNNYLGALGARTGHLYINNCDITSDSLLGGKIVDANCIATITDSEFYVNNSTDTGKSERNAIYADDGLTLNNTDVTVISNNENPTNAVRTNGKLVVNGGTYTFTNIYGFGFDGYTGIDFSGIVNATNITYGGVFSIEPTLTGAATLDMVQKGLFTPEKTINNGTYTGAAGGWSDLNPYYEAPVTPGTETYNGNIPQNGDTGFRIRMDNGYTGSELVQMNADAAKYGLHWNPITDVLTFNNATINNTTAQYAVNTGWMNTTFKFVGNNSVTTSVDMANNAYAFMASGGATNEEYTITSGDPANPGSLTVNVTNSGAGQAIAFQSGEDVRITDLNLDITSDDYGIRREDGSWSASRLLIENADMTIAASTAAISINTNVDANYYWPELSIKNSNLNILSGNIELVHSYYPTLIVFSANITSTFDIADGVRLPNDGSGLAAGSYKYKNGWVDAATIVEKPVATVDGVQYNYIGDAVAAISKSGTVTLIDDTYEAVVIPAGKTITLDLGEHTIENAGNYTILVYGTLSVKSGTNGKIIENSGVGEGVAILCYGGTIKEISGGTFEGSYAGMYVKVYSTVEKISGGVFRGSENGWSVGLDATDSVIKSISGGEFTGDEAGIGLFWATIESISGGTFKGGNNGIWLYDGSSGIGTISGGTFIGTTYHAIQATDDGYGGGFVTSITGGTFNAAQCGVYLADGQSVTVTGGRFKAAYQSWFFYGGTAIYPENYKLSSAADGEGYYTVGKFFTVSATPSKTEAAPDDIIEVPIVVTGPDAFTGMNVTLSFDANKLEFEDYTTTLALGGNEELEVGLSGTGQSEVTLFLIGGTPRASGTTVATLKFKVNSLGTAAFDLSDAGVSVSGDGPDDYMVEVGSVSSVVIKRGLTTADFTVDTGEETYTGSEITKTVTSSLTKGTDYEIFYITEKTNAGVVKFEIRGMGDYTGALEYQFTIKPFALEASHVTSVIDSEYDYTSEAIKPAIVVEALGKTLVEGEDKDYTVEYKNNIGVDTATITITGKGNYSGTIVKTFKIVSKCAFGTVSFIDPHLAAIDGKKVLLLLADTAPTGAYLYDGQPMFYLPNYMPTKESSPVPAYLYFVDSGMKSEDAILKLTDGAGNNIDVSNDGDVNKSGGTNITDAQIVYDLMYNVYKTDPNASKIDAEKRLRADVNGDGKLTTADIMIIIAKIFGRTEITE